MSHPPRIEAFKVHDPAFELVPSSPSRAWMDAFTDRHAYRCLPLTIANTHGWDVLCPADVEIAWNGGPEIADLTVRLLGPLPGGLTLDHFARSNFSRGIFTFHTGYLFRTPPGWNIFVSGPFNSPKPGAYPLTGIVESDWLPYPFTMNWQMLNPGFVRFEKGEPLCTVMPIPQQYLEEWEIVVHTMSDDPVLSAEHETFRLERDQFMKKMNAKDAETIRQAWQKHYFVGRHPDGTKVDSHTNKVRLVEPRDATGTRPLYAKDKPATESAARFLAGKDGPVAAPAENAKAKAMPWTADSILNTLDQTQNEHNFAGRKRLDKGVLSPSPHTLTLPGEIDPATLDFIYMPGFLSPEECKLMAGTAVDLTEKLHVDDIADPYWKGRILFFHDILGPHPETAALMRRAQKRITDKCAEFYGLTAPIFTDTAHLVHWRAGMFMDSHADRANPDGAPHGMPYRDFASIVYLNDDYEGGEFYFTGLDMLIKPKAGDLVAFTGGWHHEHAVLKVTKGLRLTMPAFYTFDESRKDQLFYS